MERKAEVPRGRAGRAPLGFPGILRGPLNEPHTFFRGSGCFQTCRAVAKQDLDLQTLPETWQPLGWRWFFRHS